MKINHNMSAMIANNQLLRNEDALSTSIERLSSGLKLNHASDDAAGVAIATKMKSQIKGLDQASQNAADGISVLETTDGALQEVTSMLQRMRELSVQAANGIYATEDRTAIQAEITSLTDEINRISTDTEFNTKKLLDGSLDKRVYTNNRSITRISITDTVVSDNYIVKVSQDARQAVLKGGAVQEGDIPAGTITINGVAVNITAEQDLESVFEDLRDAAEEGEVNLFAVSDPSDTSGENQCAGYVPDEVSTGSSLVFVSNRYGSAAEMNITCDNQALADFLGIPMQGTIRGVDAQIILDTGFSKQASYTCDGNQLTITDSNGFKMMFQTEPKIANTIFKDITTGDVDAAAASDVLTSEITPGTGQNILFDVTDIGTMTLQIGANENQVMEVRIPKISAESLYIDDVNVSTEKGANRGIAQFDQAISMVNETRSRMGAYQNRLEHAVTSLDATSINMTAALSRIEDVDMAQEMSTYTQYNVLTQAATSVLAQANDIPQQALQLLQ